MRLPQKVFWIFFIITFGTLILALNQFASFYTQQRFNQMSGHLNQLQSQMRQLDHIRVSLLLPEMNFDKTEFERLVHDSATTSKKLRTDLARLSSLLVVKLDSIDFNLTNFSQALLELATSRKVALQLEAAIHTTLSRLHTHNDVEKEHLTQGDGPFPHRHEKASDAKTITDLELHFQANSFVHHRQFERLPNIKRILDQINNRFADPALSSELGQLFQLLEQFYQRDLQLEDRKLFVETSSVNFFQVSQRILSELEDVNVKRQRLISQISLFVSVFGVLAAIFFWYRIRDYFRRFLYNQKQVMVAIQNDNDHVQLAPQSHDELGGLTTTLKDLSVELKGKKDDLRASEQKHRLLVETLSEWLWETNINQQFSYCSQAGEQVTGYSPSVMLGRKYLTLSEGCEDPAVVRNIEQHFFARTAYSNIERKIRCVDGSIKYLISSGSPLFDPEGRFAGFRGIDRDITALVEAKEAHVQLELKLQHSQKMESIGRLAGGVAHDFNNILSAIIGYTEVIMHRLEPDHACFRYVREIRNSGDRAANLTKQLLAFSRKQVRKPQILDLCREVSELNDMLQRLVGEEIRTLIDTEAGLWPVKMDKSQLEQVIINLAVNARDAMAEGGVISIGLRNYQIKGDCVETPNLTAGDYVQISVSDTGSGMPPDVMQNIFDPFYTTKEQGKGTGLGLAMVYGIVTQNSGDILVSSDVGRGTCFRILLPRSQPVVEQAVVSKPEKPLRKGSETILFVEDDVVLLKMNADFLQSLGYHLVTAGDGNEALEKYQQLSDGVDLLITDIVMPNIGGIALAEALTGQSPALKVLYMSGYTEHKLFDQGILKEGINFLHKPVSPIDIVKLMEKLLDSSPA